MIGRVLLYGNGKYILVDDGGYIAYSTDGINWTSKIVGSSSWQSVTYGNGKYLTVGYSGYIANSTDATDWTINKIENVRLCGVCIYQ